MNLLLLLSALLSALTGVTGGGRLAQATQVVAADRATIAAPSSKAVHAAARPLATLPSLGDVARSPALVRVALRPASLLLTTGRRRE